MTRNKSISGNTIISALLFVFSPFVSMLGAVLRAKNERNLWVLFFFYLIFGLCFTINTEMGFDSERYVAQFLSISSDNLRDIYLANITVDGDAGDVYFPIMAWISRDIAGNNYHVMFALFALVFAIFTVKTLQIFYEKSVTNYWWMYSLMVFLLIMNNSFFNINGMRFWTAAWILAYGLLVFLVKRQKHGLIWLALTPFVHVTFIFPVLVFLLSQLTGKFEKIWIVALFASIPFSFLTLELITTITDYIPSAYLNKFEVYTDREYIIERSSGIGFTYIQDFFRYCLLTFEVYYLYQIYKLRKNQKWVYDTLFHFTIIFVSLSIFLSVIPSVSRYIYVGLPFVLFLVWVNLKKTRYQKAFLMLPFIMSFTIAYTILNQIVKVLPDDFYYTNVISLISAYL